ncbi:1-(5-phosphoribosyl)-5-[(5-phosphoribosylamino)methylideneamino]imidazole-4-carboxamide isomerase [Xylella fastidiosa subsp. fastidiosa]|jgi:phosphoribosylformimino-5-aminoimidazole carboxamide ribotide isomerase|uniref:1-(5-phosphoribosyl)-5-[(5-phosphoribosylamino)methylideneamino] imidazole-4-carboxamide isomerase n=3 Tax=Xylella fastidiosa TaxID=2371 RepID=HIS4_XYLFT|nr:1-(5-phosphoribosyl)-5-[(5-phosphoribosylamino)methylideneamino]imidazole-4-carboxamide isomerase [Xylella fastidiosa]B2I5X7.1 RecName: Full=1-(5-phosphoribosyl)-5-[(5-phosphoribosylamino)methylideneamino] imidazole-4-carboxamide isomerase; AltName: Full=Phosphoribosylformimino-5-aminoimidazole carboxamide ribotide isomerase [Xylella fastidiosa M23]Q87C33.1 RecName: Full=1-(5-phosphoribosyl)-5-[(5-phosphoribosylamino)methylideneamino] imidazole-4-carboxamide isomerase; AltName: Full=Phosphorib
MNFIVYPALDIRNGAVVRLQQGDYARQTRYDDQVLPRAQAFADSGATWMHLVDLDAAKAGGYTLAPLLRQITRATGLQVQTGGGVRSRDDVARILDAGAARVVIGSLAVRQMTCVIEWLQAFGPERITVALDTRQDAGGVWRLPVHGWTEVAEATLEALAQQYAAAGLRHLLCTDIARDGMLSGPNMDVYAYLRALVPAVQIQVSGGARDVADVVAAKMAGCAGIVLGKALLEGRLALKEAVQHGSVADPGDPLPCGELTEPVCRYRSV